MSAVTMTAVVEGCSVFNIVSAVGLSLDFRRAVVAFPNSLAGSCDATITA